MAAIILLILLLAAPFVVCVFINSRTFRRYAGWNCPYQPRYDYYKDDCPRIPVSFIGAQGARLRGFLYPAYGQADELGDLMQKASPDALKGRAVPAVSPDGSLSVSDGKTTRKKLLVFCHGIWAVPEEYLTLIAWFADRGYCVFTYCVTGAGYSDGPDLRGLPNSPLDLDAALTFIENDSRFDDFDIYLMGHSWGGFAVGAGLNFDHPRVRAAVCLSGFNSVMEVTEDTLEAQAGRAGILFLPASRLIYRFLFGKQADLSASRGILHSGVPTLVVHGENDDFIHLNVSSIAKHREEMQASPVEFLLLSEKGRSEHNTYFVSREAAAEYVRLDREFGPVREAYRGKETHPAGPTDPDDMTVNNAGVPAETLRTFKEGIDESLLARPNAELFSKLEDFFERAAGHEE